MPCEARRVVVLSEEAYQRLTESHQQEPVSQPFPIQEPPKSPSPPPASPEPPVTPPPPPPVTLEVTVPVEPQPPAPLPVHVDPLKQVPPRYQQQATKLLHQLQTRPEFSWDPVSGQVFIRAKDQGISVGLFLRLVCVPFTKGSLPPDCRSILEQLGVKPRNHLINKAILPPWRPYFKF